MRAPDLFRGEMYFHALRGDKRLRYSDRRVVELGKELKASKRAFKEETGSRNSPSFPEICLFGMHACERAEVCVHDWADCDTYLCAVRLSGKVNQSTFKSKHVAMRRKVVAWRKIKRGVDLIALRFMNDRDIYLWILAGPENK